ncbi:phage tail spike protein [Bacillus mycoides]|uniref:phage tail spike protein n=2 Tax=Bacillus mycoides TaxID=1405 RepID=UPI002E1A4440|nr:phage tail spike protein [Bacillus mycoides]MED1011441.1 phage tail spike protein [Bacillus mycoides]MED1048595.1 phage tail spike protein [Bacillus mycoides]MED1052971.1 phage tail spike protein [Bacillus mycoides]
MRTPSGILHVVDSQTDQIIGAIQPKDYWNDNRHWEIKNNVDKLDFTVFDGTKESATLTQQNLVLKEVRDGRIVPYTITETEKNSSDRSLTTYASGEWILLGKANYIDPQKFEGKTVAEFVDIALLGTKWKKGNIPYESFRSMTIDEFIDPLSFLKKIASLFGLEIQYRIEVVGNQIERFVDMVKKRGQDTGKTIELGKDLIGIKRIENSQNICTALIGFVKGEGDNLITIEKINNGLPYITDSDAFQRWNEKGQHKFGFYTPETEEQNMSPERLKTLMEIEMKKRVFASVSYEVEAASIGRVFGLAHELINEGDTIRIKDTGFTPKLYLEARAIAGDESYKNPMQDKYVYGNYREIVDPNEELRKIYNRILSSLGSKQEMLDQLDKLVKENEKTIETIREESKAVKELAERVQENLKNNTVNIIESKYPPTDNLIVGKTLWRDISNGKPGILKVWNGKGWELLIPDPETIKKETLEQVNKDIKLTKEELNKKVEEAQNETAGQFNVVNENLQEVSRTIKNVQNSQGEINKTVSEMKQTNEGFTKSIELLTKKDGEITGKLNTVVETSEGTKKIISEVQQTTNDLKKTTTEITEKAGKISEKLESVEKKVANDKAGGRNLLLDSNVKYEKTDYLINQYTLSENFSAGEEYTFVIKGSVPQGQRFGIWQNGGSNNVGYATSAYASGITYVTFKAVTTTVGNEKKLSLYNAPQNTTKATVEWVALYKGNKPQDWTPAPENQVTNDDFTKKTNEIIKSVEGTTETIKKVEKTQGDFSERVNTVEKNAEGFNQSVKKLQETQTQQGKQLTEAATTIEQHSEALNLTMKKKDVEDYVGGLGTVNELRDADFKLGQKYWIWNSGNGAAGSVDTNLKYKGMNTFSITVTGQTQDRWWGLTSQSIECQVNEEFVASGYFNTDGKTPTDSGGAFIEIEWWSSDKKTRIKTARTNVKVVNNTWVRAVCTDKAPANASFVRWRYYVARNGRLWCAAPMLQRGTIATEFWLHPKDQTDADKMLDDIADRVVTEDYNKKVTDLERGIKATTEGIELTSKKQETFINETYAAYVKETGSKLKVLDEGILAEVKKGNIIAAINFSSEKLVIDVTKVNINADTMVKWLTAKGIDTNVINVNGDKITIDKNGVTVKMLDFLFQDEWGTKTTAVSRRNLIADPDFSSVGKKNIGHADYYGFEGGYGLTWKSQGNVAIEKNTHVFDYEQMVNAARVDMYNYPEAVVNNGIHPGNEYTVSAHFRTSMINGVRKTAKPRLHVCCVKFRDNVSYDIWNEQKMDFPEPSTFYGEIRRYSFTFKVPTNYKPQEHALIIKVCSANGQISTGAAICVSGVTLYSGKYASMYNWDRAAAERAAGLQPFNAIAVGSVNNNIGPAPDGQTFDISTEKDVKFSTNIRAVQGVNLGGNAFQGWGHIRFTDGNLGPGFYVSSANGWKFNALG